MRDWIAQQLIRVAGWLQPFRADPINGLKIEATPNGSFLVEYVVAAKSVFTVVDSAGKHHEEVIQPPAILRCELRSVCGTVEPMRVH